MSDSGMRNMTLPGSDATPRRGPLCTPANRLLAGLLEPVEFTVPPVDLDTAAALAELELQMPGPMAAETRRRRRARQPGSWPAGRRPADRASPGWLSRRVHPRPQAHPLQARGHAGTM